LTGSNVDSQVCVATRLSKLGGEVEKMFRNLGGAFAALGVMAGMLASAPVHA